MDFANNPPVSFVDAVQRARAHLKTPIPNNNADKLKDMTATNMHKLALELYAGGALQAVRNSELYRALRTRMEHDYFAIHGRPLPP